MTKRDQQFAWIFTAFRLIGYALTVVTFAATLAILAFAWAASSPIATALCVSLAVCTAYAGGLLIANIRTIA